MGVSRHIFLGGPGREYSTWLNNNVVTKLNNASSKHSVISVYGNTNLPILSLIYCFFFLLLAPGGVAVLLARTQTHLSLDCICEF